MFQQFHHHGQEHQASQWGDGHGGVDGMSDDGMSFSNMAGGKKRQVEGRGTSQSDIAKRLYRTAPEKLEPDQMVLCEIWGEMQKMRKDMMSELKGLAPHPTDEVFMTQTMEKKLDDIFQTFSNTTGKLELDLAHKPYFIDENPAYADKNCKDAHKRYTINGQYRPLRNDEYEEKKLREMENYRNHFYEVLHDENYRYPSEAMVVYIVIVVSIIVSVVTTMLSTVPALESHEDLWFVIELVVTICFTVEYIAKCIFVRNRVAYMLSPMNVLDFLAIVPFYVTEAMGQGDGPIASISGVLRALRLTRIAKIRQLATPYTNIILRAMIDSVLGTGSAVGIFLFIGCVFTGTLVYAAEEGNGTGFDSIPWGMWYAVVTMTTVGYGDLYPTSFPGLLLGTLTILAGLILMSLIIMVIGQYYIIHLDNYQLAKKEIRQLLYEKVKRDIQGTGPERRRVTSKMVIKQYKKDLALTSVQHLYDCIATSLRKSNEKKNS